MHGVFVLPIWVLVLAFKCFLQCKGKLVRAAGWLIAALNALQTAYNFSGRHAGHKLRNACGIAGAAVNKLRVFYNAVFYLHINGYGAGSAGFI